MWWTALAPPRQVRRLAGVNLVNNLGDGLFAAVSVVFFIDIVGLTASQVARGLAVGGLTALLFGIRSQPLRAVRKTPFAGGVRPARGRTQH
jgi:hypothetical protein